MKGAVEYVHRPITVLAEQFDGVNIPIMLAGLLWTDVVAEIRDIDHTGGIRDERYAPAIRWITRSDLVACGCDNPMFDCGSEATVGDWLVWADDELVVYSEDEFQATFVEKTS